MDFCQSSRPCLGPRPAPSLLKDKSGLGVVARPSPLHTPGPGATSVPGTTLPGSTAKLGTGGLALGAWTELAACSLQPAETRGDQAGRAARTSSLPPGALSTGRLRLPTPGWAVGLPSLGAGGQLLLSAKSRGARSHVPRVRPPSPLQEKLHFTSLSLRGPQQGDRWLTPHPHPRAPCEHH